MAATVAHSLLLLLLSCFPSPNAALAYRNHTSSCDAISRDLRRYTSVSLRWTPPSNYQCSMVVRVTSSLSLTVLQTGTNNLEYTFTPECFQASSSWYCPEGCIGLFFNVYELGSPILVRYMSQLARLKEGYLRLLYCSGRHSVASFTITSTTIQQNPSTEDPVWRILGPVLATVCIMAAVFLVCVCYAQNFYRRDSTCCRGLHNRLRRMFRCETEERPATVRASEESTQRETSVSAAHPTHCRFVPPHIAAAEMMSAEDRPPCYDDIHKYHRRESFASPPPYLDAVASLRSDMDLGSPEERREVGIDNVAFLPEVGLSDVTVEVDLADGAREERSPRVDAETAPSEGDSHC